MPVKPPARQTLVTILLRTEHARRSIRPGPPRASPGWVSWSGGFRAFGLVNDRRLIRTRANVPQVMGTPARGLRSHPSR